MATDTSRFQDGGVYLNQTSLPASAPAGAIVEFADSLYVRSGGAWLPLAGAAAGSGVVIKLAATSSTVASVDVATLFDQTLTIPADTVRVGDLVRFELFGTYTITGTPDVSFLGDINGTNNFGVFSSATAAGGAWKVSGTIIAKQAAITGAVGEFMGEAHVIPTTPTFLAQQSPGNLFTANIGSPIVIGAAVDFSAASASNTAVLTFGYAEVIRVAR